MKNIKIQFVLLLLLSSFSFRNFDDEIGKCLIQDGETISFSTKLKSPTERSSFSMQRSSYDGCKFELTIDTAQQIQFRNNTHFTGPKSDEFIIAGCTGSISRVEDELLLKFDKCKKGYYLLNIDNSTLVGEFDTIIRIVLRAELTNGKSAAYYCEQKDRLGVHINKKKSGATGESIEENGINDYPEVHTTIYLRAVPYGIKRKEMYAAKHSINTIAQFSKIKVELSNGKILEFQAGSYILAEGNSFSMK